MFYKGCWEHLREETNHSCYVENGVINIMGDNDVFVPQGNVYLIESDTGLLSTPKKRNMYLEVEIMFEPTIRLCQLVALKSLFPIYNTPQNISTTPANGDNYKVIGYTHSGTISGAVGGECKTVLTLNSGIVTFNQQKGTFTNTPTPLADISTG
jgi:hypothetical protein